MEINTKINLRWETHDNPLLVLSQLFQKFPLKDLLEIDNRKSVVLMFREPVVGNEVHFNLGFFIPSRWDNKYDPDLNDVCRNITYHFCMQMELYGKDLGLYSLQ